MNSVAVVQSGETVHCSKAASFVPFNLIAFAAPQLSSFLCTLYTRDLCPVSLSRQKFVLADRTAARSMIGCWHDCVVCHSVRLSVTLSTVTLVRHPSLSVFSSELQSLFIAV